MHVVDTVSVKNLYYNSRRYTMKNFTETNIKKFRIIDIIANQHPVMNCWLLVSFILICSIYIYSFITL